MRILIVEDDREVAGNIAKMLRESGHVVDAAHDGEDGLAMARDGAFDVLIVDRMMPRRDGLSMISILREEGDKTPALVLSAMGEVDDRVAGLTAGGDDYLVKPYAPSELKARVDALARRRDPDALKTGFRWVIWRWTCWRAP
jgi:two-component system OmpR family response regulator